MYQCANLKFSVLTVFSARLYFYVQIDCGNKLHCLVTHFLAPLDYVSRAHKSRAHEIEIRPSVRPSSVRLWHRLSLTLLYGFLLNFSCGFPWAICPDGLLIFRKKNFFDF